MPDTFRRRVAAWRTDSGVVKVNCALGRLPRFTAAPDADHPHRAMVTISTGIDATQASFEAARRGEAAPAWCELYFQTAYDPTIAPPGKHTMSVLARWAPAELAEGDWASRREQIGRRDRRQRPQRGHGGPGRPGRAATARLTTRACQAGGQRRGGGSTGQPRRVGTTGSPRYQVSRRLARRWRRRVIAPSAWRRPDGRARTVVCHIVVLFFDWCDTSTVSRGRAPRNRLAGQDRPARVSGEPADRLGLSPVPGRPAPARPGAVPPARRASGCRACGRSWRGSTAPSWG